MSEDVPVEEMGLEEMRDALVASRSEVASGKEKMAKWKTKMKGIIEEERKELVQLRDAQSGYEEKVSTLEVEMAKLKQERDLKHGHLDGTVGDTDPHSSHTISRLEAEKKALQDDFERFKERTNIAMKLRGKELASKQTKHSTLEDDLRSLQVELVMVKEELGTKEKQLDRLEEQAAQASLSMSRQLEMATRDEDRVKALYESEKLSLVARQREQIQDIKERNEQQLADTARLHEQELTQLSLKIDEAEANVVSKTQVRVDELVKRNVSLQGELDEAKAVVSGLEAAARAVAEVKNGDKAPMEGAELRELRASVRRLNEDKDHQAQRLFALQQELIEAKEAAGELKDTYKVEADLSEGQQRSYLKQVILSFLTCKTDDVRQSLIPILATLLQLSGTELKSIYLENPTWTVT